MEVKRFGTQASAKGPSDWFTGNVRIDPLFQAPDPALVQGASVRSSRVREQRGTHIRWDRRLLSQRAVGGRSAKEALLRRYIPEMWSGSRPVKSIGTEQLRQPA